MNTKLIALGLAAGLSALATSAGAAIINGDFEQAPNAGDAANTFTGWTEQAGGAATNGLVADIHAGLGANGGQHAAKLTKQPNGVLWQAVTFESKWQLDLDVAVFGSGRAFQMFLPHNGTGDRISLIIVNGDVQVYDQANTRFQNVLAGAIDGSSDGDIQVNHLRIVGDYSAAEPSYIISATDADGVTRDTQPLRYWQGNAPAQGASIGSLRFDTANLTTDAYLVIDNLAVPEPAAAAMGAGLAGGLLLRRSRTGK